MRLVATDVTLRIAGIGPFVNLGTEERNKKAEAPVGEGPRLSSNTLREMRVLLTESGLEAVGGVLADDIPAVEVDRADATCDIGGGGMRCQGWLRNHGCWETRTRRLRRGVGRNVYGNIASHAYNLQSTHDEHGDSRH